MALTKRRGETPVCIIQIIHSRGKKKKGEKHNGIATTIIRGSLNKIYKKISKYIETYFVFTPNRSERKIPLTNQIEMVRITTTMV